MFSECKYCLEVVYHRDKRKHENACKKKEIEKIKAFNAEFPFPTEVIAETTDGQKLIGTFRVNSAFLPTNRAPFLEIYPKPVVRLVSTEINKAFYLPLRLLKLTKIANND